MKLDRATFNSLLGSMNDILQRDMQRREREAAKAQRPKIQMHELKQLTILGVGTFGRVKLVVHQATNTPYALKCMCVAQLTALEPCTRPAHAGSRARLPHAALARGSRTRLAHTAPARGSRHPRAE